MTKTERKPMEYKRYIYTWSDGEFVYDEQFDENPEQPLGYAKSDDYTKIELVKGMNHIELNGMIMVVELDYWNNIWERDLFSLASLECTNEMVGQDDN